MPKTDNQFVKKRAVWISTIIIFFYEVVLFWLAWDCSFSSFEVHNFGQGSFVTWILIYVLLLLMCMLVSEHFVYVCIWHTLGSSQWCIAKLVFYICFQWFLWNLAWSVLLVFTALEFILFYTLVTCSWDWRTFRTT